MTYCVSGHKDRVSGRYLWRGLVHVRDGVIVDAAPVWGIYLGKPFSVLEDIGRERDYLIEPVQQGSLT